MGDHLHDIIETAASRGREVFRDEALAVAAVYIRDTEELQITLRNGCRLLVPVALIQGLSDASQADRAAVEISGIGYGLYWPALDMDLSVPGLFAGLTGTRRWLDSQRAARAGAAVSDAKAAAARRNGVKGGRPRNPPQSGA